MRTSDFKLVPVRTLVYANLRVPVFRIDEQGAYPGPFVRDEDLPDDLREAFARSQITAAIPFQDASYLHDFESWMCRKGKSWVCDESAVVGKYV